MDKNKEIELKFKIRFRKGIAGVENDLYKASAKDQIYCSECSRQFKERDIYYYWLYDDYSSEPSPTADDSEYLLCQKCMKGRK